MFCVERLQWLAQAFILGTIMGIAALGIGGDTGMLQLAFILQLAMMAMLFFAALTGICPAKRFLAQLFPPCDAKEADGND